MASPRPRIAWLCHDAARRSAGIQRSCRRQANDKEPPKTQKDDRAFSTLCAGSPKRLAGSPFPGWRITMMSNPACQTPKRTQPVSDPECQTPYLKTFSCSWREHRSQTARGFTVSERLACQTPKRTQPVSDLRSDTVPLNLLSVLGRIIVPDDAWFYGV